MDAEQALDELYAAAPEDFVSERKRIAKALGESGLDEDARQLAKLRKPSVAAWALNQLSRQSRRDVDLLLDAGHRLREAQAGILGGAERETFEQARKAERDAVSRLTAEAEELLRTRGTASASSLNQIGESLRAAAISPEGRELLARGRFTQPLQTQGFDLVADLGLSAQQEARPARARAAELDEQRKAKEALREAKERLRTREQEARTAEREAERLKSEADKARRKADEARAKVEAAAADVEEAETSVRRARG
jgi:hypothetical protein